ncbi:copper-binding transcription factor [Aspergillus hancockii]|nr:copper-binding transcription factor [Aspergillus hancockii]
MTNILNRFDLDALSTRGKSDPQEELPVPRGILKTHIESLEDSNKKSDRPSQEPKEPRKKIQRVNHHTSDSGLGTSIRSSETMSSTKGNVTAGQVCQASVDHSLSKTARVEIQGRILFPLLMEEKFQLFHPLVRGAHQQIEKDQLKCLRDVEKTLLFSTRDVKASTAAWYTFCRVTIHCIHETSNYLRGRDLTLPNDVPYTNNYFLDLVTQINRFARIRDAARERSRQESGDKTTKTSEPRLELVGGLSETGKPAELVMHKDGKLISMQTEEPYNEHNIPSFKRTLSVETVDEGVERSMARRKKNAPPMDINQKCRFCDRVLKRPCDLTKHEKTHSRPYKCREPSCKYHEMGFPTEKETERHYNDKHCKNPRLFRCRMEGCTYASKRESNCKQHMEKTHNWVYERTKNNGKNKNARQDSAQPTPQTTGIPSPAASNPTADFSTPGTGPTASPSAPSVAFPEAVPFSFADPPMPTQSEDFQLFSNSPISLGGSPYHNINDVQAFPPGANFDLNQHQIPGIGSPASGSSEFLTPPSGTTHSPYDPINPFPENSLFFDQPYTQAKADESLLFVSGGFGDVPSMFDQNPLDYLTDPMYSTAFMGYETVQPQLEANPNAQFGMDPWDDFIGRPDPSAM